MMKVNPLVSVIIPVYSGSHLLRRAVDSALSQDVPLEIIVINDASPENVDTVMEGYRKHEAVIYLKNPHNMGAAESRNRGIAQARGKYVAFLDADDCWAEGKLRRQVSLLEQTGLVLCATGRELMHPDGTSTGRVISVPETITYRDLLKHNCISCSSVVIRTEAAREFPMHHAQDSHEDYIMWLEVLRKYQAACGINEPLLKYTVSIQGKSGSKRHSAAMTYRVYQYMGFSPIRSALCFCSYALNGVWKHYIKK